MTTVQPTRDELLEAFKGMVLVFGQVIADIDSMPPEERDSEFAVMHFQQLTEDYIHQAREDGQPLPDSVIVLLRFQLSLIRTFSKQSSESSLQNMMRRH